MGWLRKGVGLEGLIGVKIVVYWYCDLICVDELFVILEVWFYEL